MKRVKIYLAVVLALVAQVSIMQAQDKTESPYFLIENGSGITMPLESNQAEVFIAGMIADVNLTQTYRNNSDEIIEAIYVFPGSDQSAVYDMEMQIGSRIIKAELKEKEDARKTYEEAKAAGKRTSLLEQHRPNVFQMNVANILPGERIQVRIKYTEKIIPTHGNYEFILPTVVGPRYNQPNKDNHASFVNMPYHKENTAPSYTFDIKVFLQAGQTIQHINSHSHKINVKSFSDKLAQVSINKSELYAGNKDFVLKYRLANNAINSGLLLYEHEDENFFMANIQPPNIIADYQVPAKEYVFIMDVSGSMFGFPLEVSKKLMKDLLMGLKPTDKFNLMLFAGTSYVYSDTSIYANTENIDAVISDFEDREGGGSTNLLPALKKAINLPLPTGGLSRSIVILTDGYITVEKEAFELVRNNLNRANVYAFGIGSSTDRFLINGLANVGKGLPFVVENMEVACDVAEEFKNYISSPSLTNITVKYEGFNAYDLELKSIPDLLGERPINILGKWNGVPEGKIIIEGYFAGTRHQQIINISDYTPDSRNQALRMLWAREQLRLMDDYRKILYNDNHKEAMTKLSLKYNLLSAYTSFVAVDYEKANNGQEIKLVKQALPLPQGVSNSAIGAEMEIEEEREADPTAIFLTIGAPSGIHSDEVTQQMHLKFIMNIQKIKQCIEASLIKECLITLKFDEEGMLESVELTEIDDRTMKDCLKKEIMSWDFSTMAIDPMSDIMIPVSISN